MLIFLTALDFSIHNSTVEAKPLLPHFNRTVVATEQACPQYDLGALFYDDYVPGTRWGSAGSVRTVRWSLGAQTVANLPVWRQFSESEILSIRSAFSQWDSALDSITLVEVGPSDAPEVTIGWTAFTDFPNLGGYWTSSWNSQKIRNVGAIRLNATNSFLLSSPTNFIHGVLHEIGNVLGMGDISPREDIESVQEDPWQPPFGPTMLSAFDRRVIRQIYGESTCDEETPQLVPTESSTTTTTLAQPAVLVPVIAPAKVFRVRCVKGKITKFRLGTQPRCPKGFSQVGPKRVVP